MAMLSLDVDLPSRLSPDEAKVLLAVKLFEVGKATLGQAAKLAGVSKRSMIEILGRHKIPVINYSADELRAEVVT
jgi:predicted HTH domain antitoxin